MLKRGQVTVFIIIGIVLLIGFATYLSIYKTTTTPLEVSPLIRTEPIIYLIEDCLEETTKESIFENGYNGGYFITELEPPFYKNVPYYLYQNKSYMINLEKFQEEMQKYIESRIGICLGFEMFEKEGYNITIGEPKSRVIISPTKITSNLEMNTQVSKGIYVTEISSFKTEIKDDNLYEDVIIVNRLINQSYGKGICISCFAKAGSQGNLTFNVNTINDNSYLIQMEDHDYEYGFKNYVLNFAVSYAQD